MTIYATDFTKLLNISYPIVQAPMAGGHTTPALVSAISNAGALGGFGAAVLSPENISQGIRDIRQKTDKPFVVNLFVLDEIDANSEVIARAQARLAPARKALNLPEIDTPTRFFEDNQAQIQAALQAAPPAVSFTFEIPDDAIIQAFKQAGSIVIGTATNVKEAQAWEKAGADALCIQGIEAGGHRGTIPRISDEHDIGIMTLISDVARAVSIPFVAAGGIMDGHALRAAIELGAHGAQIGTAFLCCDESGTPKHWKDALLNAGPDSTEITRAFSGRPARALRTAFAKAWREHPEDIAPYPIQNTLTRDIRKAAATQHQPDYFSYWSGQGVSRMRPMPAQELIRTLIDEFEHPAKPS